MDSKTKEINKASSQKNSEQKKHVRSIVSSILYALPPLP